MPNHITNEIIFRGVSEDRKAAILAAALNKDGEIDFRILLPVPLNAWMGNVGLNHERAFKTNALDWCRDHWGTKWNAYSARSPDTDSDDLRLVFDTAWRPPYGWLCALFNTVEASFEHNWLDEGAERGWSGRFSFNPDSALHTIEWQESLADDSTQRHLMVLKWGEETALEIEKERYALSPNTESEQ